MTTLTSNEKLPLRPTYGYTGRYTNPPFMCPINGWMIDGEEVDRETALKAFERYADALEKRQNTHETSEQQRTALDEAYDLLTCARPAEHLEGATDEEWYAQRAAWCGRNPLERPAQKASAPLPRCDCDPDTGCRTMDPTKFICCLEEIEAKSANGDG